MQRISNGGKIQNTVLTPDNVPNASPRGSPCFDKILYVGDTTHVKWP